MNALKSSFKIERLIPIAPLACVIAIGLLHTGVILAQEMPQTPPLTTTPPAPPTDTAVAPGSSAASGASSTTTSTSTTSSTTTTTTAATRKKQVLSFENADLRVVLQALAKQAGMSLIIPEDVKGTVTARLVDIPIDKAMKTILESKGYSLVELDGVYQVKSRDAISQEPTTTQVYQFTNANAKEAKPTVDKLLTKNGNAQLDERSNSLIITDVPSNLAKVMPIIQTLDSATPQVLIETKLMEMTRNPQEAVGVNWQSLASYQVSLASPNAAVTGSGSDNTSSGRLMAGITRSGAPGDIGVNGMRDFRRGGVLTPIGYVGATAAVPYPFAAVLDAPAFSATLSFLMQDSDTELLGSPKVITADNKEAKIRIATQEPIPNFTFNQQTASFVISGFEFKDVGNVLTVTPHVNKEKFITMDVEPQVSTALTGSNGRSFALPGGSVNIPLISVRTLNSRVMVKSGHTLALGGLLESNATRSFTKVPYLGDLPVIGDIFRSHNYSKTKRNLLVFITPTIINPGEGSGYEDQYAQLREKSEDERFAYKKSFIGNAKPRDQFEPFELASDTGKQSTAPAPTSFRTSTPAPAFSTGGSSSSTSTSTTTTHTESSTVNSDHLAPRFTPALRD